MAHTNKLAIELVQGSTSRLPLLNNHSLGKSLNQPLSFPFIEIQLFVLRFLNVIRLSKRLYICTKIETVLFSTEIFLMLLLMNFSWKICYIKCL